MLPSHKDPERTNVVCLKAGLPEIPDSESGLPSSLRRRAAPALRVQPPPASIGSTRAALQGGGHVPQTDRVSSRRVLQWEEFLMGAEHSWGGALWGRSSVGEELSLIWRGQSPGPALPLSALVVVAWDS